MRIHTAVRALAVLLTLASAGLAHAQFTPPTDDELKMTADPKAPGAAAVYLYNEDVTDDANHFHTFYVRIKVLTEKGKELATVRTPYEHGIDTVTDIQGRTIHADGAIVPLTAKPTDLMDFKVAKFQVNTVVFTMPSVEVGSILEYRLKIRSPDGHVSEPSWDLQQDYFVHKAHYSFHPYLAPGHYVSNNQGQTLNRLMYSVRLATETKLAYDIARDTYSLDLTDIPAIPTEDWMPPLNTLKWRVEFYYTNATSGPAFWEDAGKHWAKQVQEFIKETGGLKKAADGIVAPGDTDAQKAAKIYTAVMKLDNTAFSRTKSEAERKKEKLKQIHTAEDVWKQQSGSDDDIALLYVALARATGLKAWPMQVVDRKRAMYDSNYLSVRQLDDFLAVVVIDGKNVFLDPGQKLCPYGMLAWKHTLATGFLLTEKGAVPASTPGGNYKAAVLDRVADLTVDAKGDVKGTLRFVIAGPEALYWRQLTLENDQDEVKKQFNDSMKEYIPEGVQGDFDHFLGLEEYDTNLIGIVKVSGNLGAATGKRFFLPGLFFESRAKHPFVTEVKRLTPIDVHYPGMVEDQVTYYLPPGFTVESAPQTTHANWPDHAVLTIRSTTTADSIEVNRSLAYNFTLLDPRTYPELHDFYQKVATADQQQIVLTRATPAKGN